MRPQYPRPWLALVVAAFALSAGRAGADPASAPAPLALEWIAPAECPTRADVLRDVARLVGPAATPDRPVAARALLFRGEDQRWHVQITTLGESGGERSLDAASCEALTRATVLVLAIRIKPGLVIPGATPGAMPPAPAAAEAGPDAGAIVPPAAAAPSTPPPVPPVLTAPLAAQQPEGRATDAEAAPTETRPSAVVASDRRFAVGALVMGTLGELPSAEAGGGVAVGFTRGRFRAELHGETGFVQQGTAGTNLGGGSIRAAGGGLRACYGPTSGAFTVLGCADGEVDWLWVDGYGTSKRQDQNAGRIDLGAGVQGRWRLASRFALRLDVEALVPLARPSFVTEGASGKQEGVAISKPAPYGGRVGLGIDALFF
jgi:hypothetical protein